MVWLRRMSKIMDSDQFSIGLIDALQNDDVISKFSQMFSKSLKEESDSLRQEIGTLRNELKGRDAKITKLEKDVVDLQDKFDDQEQYSRRNTLCISNIPEKQFEDTTVMALKLFNDKMKVAVTVNDIDWSHRYGKKKPNSPRGIMVKFATYRARHAVFRAKSSLGPNGALPAPAWTAAAAAGLQGDTPAEGAIQGDTPAEDATDRIQRDAEMAEFENVYISENLTDRRQYLMFLCRVARRKRTLKKCWSSDGQILVLDNDSKIVPVSKIPDLSAVTGLDFNEVIRELDASRQPRGGAS